jgi:hypothetical protein
MMDLVNEKERRRQRRNECLAQHGSGKGRRALDVGRCSCSSSWGQQLWLGHAHPLKFLADQDSIDIDHDVLVRTQSACPYHSPLLPADIKAILKPACSSLYIVQQESVPLWKPASPSGTHPDLSTFIWCHECFSQQFRSHWRLCILIPQ